MGAASALDGIDRLRGDATFVQENQLRRIDLAGFLPPDTAPELARSCVLLGGVE